MITVLMGRDLVADLLAAVADASQAMFRKVVLEAFEPRSDAVRSPLSSCLAG